MSAFFLRVGLSLGYFIPLPCMALSQQTAPIRIQLQPGSAFTTGCLPPCQCALTYAEAIGSLEMTRLPISPQFADVYAIDDVAIVLSASTAGNPLVVTGTGSYWISAQLGFQERIFLDLSFNGGPAVHFESPWSAIGASTFPEISIVAAENNFSCLQQLWDLRLKPDLATNFCTSLPNSTGSPAQISALGSNSVFANDLELRANSLPASKPGLFYFGAASAQVPFGDGFRCVDGPGMTRFSTSLSSSGGVLGLSVDNTNLPNGALFFPGTTWHFQAWYRDPAANQSGFNLSDGMAILFGL